MASRSIPNPQAVTITVAQCGTPLDLVTKRQFESLLDDDETARYRAYRYPEHAELYLTAHALLRTTLSRHASLPPAAWRFVYGGHGRPEIAAEQNQTGLRFNLSHTNGLVACAVAHHVAVGVDVEPIDRKSQALPIAQRFFSRNESQVLAELPTEVLALSFVELWTLKEAFIKARGGGLSIPLERFSMQRDDSGTWQVSFVSDEFGEPGEWQFASMRPTLCHRLAVAIYRPGKPDLVTELCEVAPESFLEE